MKAEASGEGWSRRSLRAEAEDAKAGPPLVTRHLSLMSRHSVGEGAFFPLTFTFTFLVMIDTGLFLLRAAGFLLAFTFGIQKIGWYVTAFHAGKPLSSIGLAPLIAHVGFPLPIILALWITLNESIGAFFIGIGFLTRFAAASAALGMIGALYTSVRLGEDWLRAALYLIIFTGLTFTGPGRFSIDHLLQTRKTNRTGPIAGH
jgi:uncharacterized membrane protein YphA (DoxX/SURF4 family)